MQDINIIRKEIVQRLAPLNLHKIVLFGSYAWGTPDENSDIDLYVVTNDNYIPGNWKEKSNMYLEIIRHLDDIQKKTPVDLIAHTKPMYENFKEMDSMFSRKIFRDGISLL